MSIFAPNPPSNTSFIVKNISTSGRTIKIFNTKIYFNTTVNLLNVPGVSIEDIKTSLHKGELAAKLRNGNIQITFSDIDTNTTQAAFLRSNRAVTPWDQQAVWYIDPLNGNDEADGNTISTPIKNHQTLVDRIGKNTINQATTVNLMNDFGTSNPIYLPFRMGNSGSLLYTGTKTLTTLYTGTFTTATAINAASNEGQIVGDTSIPTSWTAAGLLNTATGAAIRIRITGGARSGAISYPARDLGSFTVRTSPFIVPNTTLPIPAGPPPAVVSPQVGDPFVVETSLASISDFVCDMSGCASIPTPSGAGVRLMFAHIDLPNNASNRPQASFNQASGSTPEIIFSACGLGQIRTRQCTNLSIENCKMGQQDIRHGQVAVVGGLVTGVQQISGAGARCQYLRDCLMELGGRITAETVGVILERVGIFNNTGSAGSGGDAILVRPGGGVRIETIASAPAVYGKDNAQYGLNVQSLGGIAYTVKPTVTGATNDTLIGGTATAYGAVPFINTTNNAAVVLRA